MTTSGMFATSSKVDWKPRSRRGRGLPTMATYSCSSCAGVKPSLAAISKDLSSFFSISISCARFDLSTLEGKERQDENNLYPSCPNTGREAFQHLEGVSLQERAGRKPGSPTAATHQPLYFLAWSCHPCHPLSQLGSRPLRHSLPGPHTLHPRSCELSTELLPHSRP